jgi:hypothetical protein
MRYQIRFKIGNEWYTVWSETTLNASILGGVIAGSDAVSAFKVIDTKTGQNVVNQEFSERK